MDWNALTALQVGTMLLSLLGAAYAVLKTHEERKTLAAEREKIEAEKSSVIAGAAESAAASLKTMLDEIQEQMKALKRDHAEKIEAMEAALAAERRRHEKTRQELAELQAKYEAQTQAVAHAVARTQTLEAQNEALIKENGRLAARHVKRRMSEELMDAILSIANGELADALQKAVAASASVKKAGSGAA